MGKDVYSQVYPEPCASPTGHFSVSKPYLPSLCKSHRLGTAENYIPSKPQSPGPAKAHGAGSD